MGCARVRQRRIATACMRQRAFSRLAHTCLLLLLYTHTPKYKPNCRAWLSLVLLAAAAALAFAVLLTVSERFFCPALELISDYLKLPPVVAGATLLSFGNGAPDTFTQVAAVGQASGCIDYARGGGKTPPCHMLLPAGRSSALADRAVVVLVVLPFLLQEGGRAVGMALSEPLGGGMFASNVVFGLVVLIASKQQVRGWLVECVWLETRKQYAAAKEGQRHAWQQQQQRLAQVVPMNEA